MASQLEFERITQKSLIDEMDNHLSQEVLLRLSWLATKQEGSVVPASLDDYAKSIKAVGYKVEPIPFGEPDTTQQSQPSSDQVSPTPN